jgi:hypothetical protein
VKSFYIYIYIIKTNDIKPNICDNEYYASFIKLKKTGLNQKKRKEIKDKLEVAS